MPMGGEIARKIGGKVFNLLIWIELAVWEFGSGFDAHQPIIGQRGIIMEINHVVAAEGCDIG